MRCDTGPRAESPSNAGARTVASFIAISSILSFVISRHLISEATWLKVRELECVSRFVAPPRVTNCGKRLKLLRPNAFGDDAPGAKHGGSIPWDTAFQRMSKVPYLSNVLEDHRVQALVRRRA